MCPSISWQSVVKDFVADGSLRDIYVFHANEAIWSHFLTELRTTSYSYKFFHGGEPMDSEIEQFEQAATLRQVDPVLLKIMVGHVQVNCHFFTPDEIELDIDPREVADESSFHQLLDFLKWLAATLDRSVSVNHENSKDLTILQVSSDGGVTIK